MKTTLIAIALAGALLVSGCATQTGGSQASPGAAPAAAQPPVPIPRASATRLVLHLTGASQSTSSKDWQAFRDEWRATFADHAKRARVDFSLEEGPVRTGRGPGTLLNVHVNDYRMVGIGARVFLGVMTGNAFIDAKANYQDLNTGALFGARDINTTSSAWHGVFAKMTPQQIDAIAADVFRALENAR